MGHERTLPGVLAQRQVNSPSRITLENNGKILPLPDREKLSSRASGGGNGTGVEPSLGSKTLILIESDFNCRFPAGPSCERRPKPVPLEPHSLVADVDLSLVK